MFWLFWLVCTSVSRIAYKVMNGFACMPGLSSLMKMAQKGSHPGQSSILLYLTMIHMNPNSLNVSSDAKKFTYNNL